MQNVIVHPGVGYESEQLTLLADGTVEQFDAAKITKVIGEVGGDGGGSVRAWRATFVPAADVRVLWDGSNPVQSTSGVPLVGGGVYVVEGYENVANFRICDDSASGQVVEVMYDYL